MLLTFTGADDSVGADGMFEIGQHYPVEWGILFSKARQGTPRYPSLNWVRALTQEADRRGARLSAHLCGEYSRFVAQGQPCGLENLLGAFARVQVNSSAVVDPAAVVRWAKTIGPMPPRPILQCRGDFPDVSDVDWLYDPSGGQGLHPSCWPSAPTGMLTSMRVGYAGGINPSNIARVAAAVGGPRVTYWLDAETGLRDDADRFSLDKCWRMCEAVYGSPQERDKHASVNLEHSGHTYVSHAKERA